MNARIECRSNEWLRYQNHLKKDDARRGLLETAEYIKRLQIQIDMLSKEVKELNDKFNEAFVTMGDDSK